MRANEIQNLVRPNIARLCPYSTARDEYQGAIGIFLDANESPYSTGFNRYPDPHQKALKARLSEIKGVPAENIFIGNGSDEAIDLVFRIFCDPGKDNVVAISPSYGMYAVAADINNVEVRSVALNEDFTLPVQAVLDSCDSLTKAIFLCSPNNPSGNAFSKEDIRTILKKADCMVVLDEAYADFSTIGSMRSEINEFPNLIVLQTLSKAWGLAGLRLGLAFSNAYVSKVMGMVKYPYNINQAAQDLVMKALELPIDSNVHEIIEQRGIVAKALAFSPVIEKVYPSDANFVLVRVDDADRLYAHMLADGIIVRNRNRVPGCKGCLRITIGLPEENRKMIQSLRDYEKGNIRR